MRKLAGFLAVMMLATMVPALQFSAAAAATENVIYVQEDFSSKEAAEAKGWTFPDYFEFTSDGTLKVDNVVGDGTAAEIALSGINTASPWVISFKVKVDSGYLATNTCIGGFRLANRTIGFSNKTLGANYTMGTWRELLLSYSDAENIHLYYRDYTNGVPGGWMDGATIPSQAQALADAFRISANSGGANTAEFDDVLIYQGHALKVAPVTVDGSTVKTSAEVYGAPPSETFTQNFSLIAVDYAEDHVSAMNVANQSLSTTTGWVDSGEITMNLPGFAGSASDVTMLAWDSMESGIPLMDAVGSTTGNAVDKNLEPADGQAQGITVNSFGDTVSLEGYIGGASYVTASLQSNSDGNFYAVTQVVPNQYGMVKTDLRVNPTTAPTGSYTLRVRYGDTAQTTPGVMLATEDGGYTPIGDKDDLKAYIDTYVSNQDIRDIVATEEGKDLLYACYLEAKGKDPSASDSKLVVAAVDAYNYDVTLLAEVNAAAAGDKWSVMETLITVTYKDYLGSRTLAGSIQTPAESGVENADKLFERMVGADKNYLVVQDILDAYTAAVTAQLAAEADPEQDEDNTYQETPTQGTTLGGGYGGGGPVTVTPKGEKEDTETEDPETEENQEQEEKDDKPVLIPSLDFTDLGTVAWAEESILALQQKGIVSGEGDGNFYPNRPVTREEFLKMLMSAAAIKTTNGGNVAFGDMEQDAWYYNYVATAYAKGIVNGVSDTQFGIGQNISRADMAVMLYRTLEDCLSIDIERTKPAFVFSDFDQIPGYAEEGIAILAQAGLMNGAGENTFMPAASATRAEAAVAIYRIYNYIIERR